MAGVDEFGLPVDDDDEEPETPKTDSDGIKQLRKAFKDKSKQLDEALAKLTAFERKAKAESAGSLFESAGASPKLAKFYLADAGDVEPDEAGVKAWLAENGELFGYQPEEPVDSETKNSFERVNAAQQGGKAVAGGPESIPGRLDAIDVKASDFYEQMRQAIASQLRA